MAGKELNFSRRVWCEQYQSKKSTLSHETKVQYWPLAVYHIFHNTDAYSLFSLYKRGGIEIKVFKKKNFEKKLTKIFGKKILRKKLKKKNLGKKNVEIKFLKQKFWEKHLKKNWKKIEKKFGKNIFWKKFWQTNFGKINYKTKMSITKLYSNIDKCHTIFSLLAPFDKTGRKTGKTNDSQ